MVTRLLSLIVTLAALLGLAACGDNTPAPAPAPSGTSSTTAPKATNVTVTEATATQAQTLLDQAMQAIKDNKLDVAEKAVSGLESMKPNLSAEWQGRVDQARTALETAKKAGGLKSPELPKLPG